MAYSCTPSGRRTRHPGRPGAGQHGCRRRGSTRARQQTARSGVSTRRRTGRPQAGTRQMVLPRRAFRTPTRRDFSPPSALRRSQEGFHFAVLPLNTRKLPSADTEGHGSFSTSSLRPLRPLRLKATIPFPCFQCIPWLNNPPRLSFSPAGPQAAPVRVPRRGFLCFQW